MSETITTAGELDALPHGSVVIDCLGNVWVRVDDSWNTVDRYDFRSYGAARLAGYRAPVTVAYRPDRPQRTEAEIKAEALREIRAIANRNATTAYALGHSAERRRWLDFLALCDRIEAQA